MMEGFQSLLIPQLATLRTDVVTSVTASVNDRFMDLENNMDQLKTTMDIQQQVMKDEISKMLKRLETVEKENAILRGAPLPAANQQLRSTAPNPPVQGSAASKYATTAANQESPTAAPNPRTTQQQSNATHYTGSVRYFTPFSSNQGFQHLYLPSRGRRSYREVRDLLANKIHMDRGAIIDMHYPSSNVIAILFHNDYIDTATQLLRAQKLAPLEGFNPYDHHNLGNKEFANAPVADREAKMKEVVEHQPYVTIGFIKRPDIKLAVARDFHRKGKITSEFLQDLVNLHTTPRPTPQDTQHISQPTTDAVMQDDQEDESMDHLSMHSSEMDNSNIMERHPSTGEGEPVAAL
ncbi:hypothetical protein MAM1_0315d09574 [Mucor ambiguus]|uniref:Uncharacterized protein n=1 Tax=Mucor ambiguus TaxID=91626 RepID=A0A0C9LXG1_9FUNG|nr:hypothetical protein MAM1_0315d09574 [Mucor ambiguus]